MKKKLPFCIDVEMKMYHNKSFPLGIIKANIKDYDTWLSSKFINCVCRGNVFDSVEEDVWSVNEGLTFSQGMWLEPTAFSVKGFNLLEFNKNMLEKENYITGIYNEFYIPQKKSFNVSNFDHDYLIFGFDDEQKVFKSAGYLKNGDYSLFDISYDDYYQSVIGATSKKIGLNFYKIDSQFVPKIDIAAVKNKLRCYLESSLDENGNVYGVEVWERLAQYVINNDEIDIRYGRVYMEHHGVMLNRMKTFIKLGYNINDEIENKYFQIYSMTQRVHNMFLKYNLSPNKELQFRISDIIKRVTLDERRVIKQLVNNL